MSILRNVSLVALAIVCCVGIASADSFAPVDVNATVQVWTGTFTNAQQQADNANPLLASTPTWQFTYTGPINFINNCAQSQSGTCNTFAAFGFSGANTSSFTVGNQASFLSAIMSLPNSPGSFDTGLASLLHFAFNLSVANGTPGTVSHDDGASLYGPGGVLVHSPNLTSEIANSFNYSGSGAYDLYYVEGNGSPSDLVLTSQVPEPSSLLLLGSGLAGLSGLVRRRFLK